MTVTKNKFFSANVTALNNDGNYLLPLVGTSGINFDKYLGLGQGLRKSSTYKNAIL